MEPKRDGPAAQLFRIWSLARQEDLQDTVNFALPSSHEQNIQSHKDVVEKKPVIF